MPFGMQQIANELRNFNDYLRKLDLKKEHVDNLFSVLNSAAGAFGLLEKHVGEGTAAFVKVADEIIARTPEISAAVKSINSLAGSMEGFLEAARILMEPAKYALFGATGYYIGKLLLDLINPIMNHLETKKLTNALEKINDQLAQQIAIQLIQLRLQAAVVINTSELKKERDEPLERVILESRKIILDIPMMHRDALLAIANSVQERMVKIAEKIYQPSKKEKTAEYILSNVTNQDHLQQTREFFEQILKFIAYGGETPVRNKKNLNYSTLVFLYGEEYDKVRSDMENQLNAIGKDLYKIITEDWNDYRQVFYDLMLAFYSGSNEWLRNIPEDRASEKAKFESLLSEQNRIKASFRSLCQKHKVQYEHERINATLENIIFNRAFLGNCFTLMNWLRTWRYPREVLWLGPKDAMVGVVSLPKNAVMLVRHAPGLLFHPRESIESIGGFIKDTSKAMWHHPLRMGSGLLGGQALGFGITKVVSRIPLPKVAIDLANTSKISSEAINFRHIATHAQDLTLGSLDVQLTSVRIPPALGGAVANGSMIENRSDGFLSRIVGSFKKADKGSRGSILASSTAVHSPEDPRYQYNSLAFAAFAAILAENSEAIEKIKKKYRNEVKSPFINEQTKMTLDDLIDKMNAREFYNGASKTNTPSEQTGRFLLLSLGKTEKSDHKAILPENEFKLSGAKQEMRDQSVPKKHRKCCRKFC